MDLINTTTILTRLLEQTEYSLEYNNEKILKAKDQCIKDSNTKMWIEAIEERVIRINEEVDALRQALSTIEQQQEFQEWKIKQF